MNILVLGGGGREHAIVHALSKSKILGEKGKLHCAPGNPGIAALATLHDVDVFSGAEVAALCAAHDIEFVVVGPEAILVAGVADDLRAEGIRVFGPGETGAILEGSKAFAKKFMKRNGIATANFEICKTIQECENALSMRNPPYVIKADGLAAGKGVFLPTDVKKARRICEELLGGKKLGSAGITVVIEDYMPGQELSVLAMTDGESLRILPPGRDHKRVYDGDEGPNTGGMGAYSPVRLPDGLMERIEREILIPTLRGLKEDGIDYRGVLYAGLMLSDDCEKISVVEYNVRFGDPETQVMLPILRDQFGDFGEAALLCAEGRLSELPAGAEEDALHAVCVVLTSGGYPGEFKKDRPISGLENELPDTYVYHSGTKAEGGEILTNGGRVLTVVGIGDTFVLARQRAYARADLIHFEDMHYRRDIGWSEEKQWTNH